MRLGSYQMHTTSNSGRRIANAPIECVRWGLGGSARALWTQQYAITRPAHTLFDNL